MRLAFGHVPDTLRGELVTRDKQHHLSPGERRRRQKEREKSGFGGGVGRRKLVKKAVKVVGKLVKGG